MKGRLVFLKHITRDMLRAEPEARFVFGDNVARRGMGGQAREMRGEPNAIGIPTKWEPSMRDVDFFNDHDNACVIYVNVGILCLELELLSGRTVYYPADGIGTGLAELHERAPKLHAYITETIARLTREYPA